jgi:tripartite-type tricarboxylate transporter receptor subunit TctC
MKGLSAWLTGLLLIVGALAPAFGQWVPIKPIKMIVPYAPGGAADLTARLMAEQLTVSLGQSVIVENRAGGGGVIGADLLAKAAPDGYTISFGSDPPFTINPHLHSVPYDALKSFSHVSLVANLPLVLVVNPQKMPVKNVAELIALAKANPGKYTIASSGNGSSGHLAAELFKHEAGINLVHVPYKGQAPANTDMISGHVDVTFSSIGPATQHFKSGRLIPLAVSTSSRFSGLPEVASLAQTIPGFDIGVWLGLSYPAGTPQAAIDRMSHESDKILNTPAVIERFKALGYVPVGGKPEVLTKRIESDYSRFGEIIRTNNIKGD